MGEPEIKFGDKVFIYGHFLENLDKFEDLQYNTVLGYITVGGFIVKPVETDIQAACICGFVAEMPIDENLASPTPFSNAEMVDITYNLAFSPPLPHGCKVWMPTTTLL